MESSDFTIAYDGEALNDHRMDVRDLAPALLSFGRLFDEANRVLNGDKSSVKLHVKAHRPGSFQVSFELVQSFGSQISQFLSGDFVTSALNLKELLITGSISLWWVTKKLKGQTPGKMTDLKNGSIRVEWEGETFDVPLQLLRLYQDADIRKTAHDILKPLEREGIDAFLIKTEHRVIERITKEERVYFLPPMTEDEEVTAIEHEAVYSIVSLAFKDDNKWRLHDGNTTIHVWIKDEDFKDKVDRNIVSFSKGDLLRCRVKMTQWRTKEGLKTDYELLEVKEHMPAARQLFLF